MNTNAPPAAQQTIATASAPNPLAGNPLATRDDAARAVRDLLTPLLGFIDGTGARIVPGQKRAHFDELAAAAEGVCRPLWGIVPLLADGSDLQDAERFLEAARRGTDASHPGYWGDPADREQRIVEAAALGVALMMTPERILAGQPRPPIIDWLTRVSRHETHPNNWRWFRVLVTTGLLNIGEEVDLSTLESDLDFLESCALTEGWYADGHKEQRDYYVPMAMHFYALIFAACAPSRFSERADRLKDRARLFAPDFAAWFADDGAAIPFGRSLTYRFATCAFWGALAFADAKPNNLSWGQIRGLWARQLRWWSDKPIATDAGVLSVGYAYPSELMSEQYNSSASPYWCMKAFLPLALPLSHPFWRAEEEPHPHHAQTTVHAQPNAHAILMRSEGDATMLTGGQHCEPKMRAIHAKYCKFAYSSRFAFSVPSDVRTIAQVAPDSSLCFSLGEDEPWIGRARCSYAHTTDQYNLTRWSPTVGVTVTTWLIPCAPFHVRIHRIETDHPCDTVEAGFCQPVAPDSAGTPQQLHDHAACITTHLGTAALIDASPASRTASVIRTDPGTNLHFPRAMLGILESPLGIGTTTLACIVSASPAQTDVDEIMRTAPTVSFEGDAARIQHVKLRLELALDAPLDEPNNQLGFFDR